MNVVSGAWIDGRVVPLAATFDVFNPATGDVVASAGDADVASIK